MPIGHPSAAEAAAIIQEATADAATAAAELAERAKNVPTAPPGTPASSHVGALTAGTKLPGLSNAEATSARADWVKAFIPPKDATPEEISAARTAHVARFDAALKSDGLTLETGPSPETVARHSEYGLPVEPKASDYQPLLTDLARTLPPERFQAVQAESGAFAAALGLSPAIGNAVLDHIADIGPAFQAMSDDAKVQWLDGQRSYAVKHFGSAAAAKEATDRAKALLSAIDLPMSKALLGSSVVNSWWLISTLASHAKAREMFNAKYPK